MYFILGISLIFTFLFVINAAATVAATGIWRAVAGYARENWTARRRTDFIFALLVFPFIAALLFVAAFLIPAFLLFEPRSTKEIAGFAQSAVCAISVAGFLTAVYRFFQARSATRGLVSGWLKDAEPIAIDGVSVPVYRIRHPFPVLAVVGTWRPQMFVARQIFDHLTAEEFQAAIAHETGHLAARDNFRRTLLRFCRDLLVFPFGRTLDRNWAASAEAGADEYAAQTGGNLTAVNLAAALVKIARIVPRDVKPTMPAGAYLIEAQMAEVAFRVENLLKFTKNDDSSSQSAGKIAFPLYFAFYPAVILPLAADQNFLLKIYHAVEFFVSLQR